MLLEKHLSWAYGRVRSASADILAGLIGWFVLLAFDPQSAWFGGTFVAVLLVALWRAAIRSGAALAPFSLSGRLRARLAIVLMTPTLGLVLTASYINGATGVMIGLAAACLVLAAVEALVRRYRRSTLGHFPLSACLAFLVISFSVGHLSLERGFGRWPNENYLKRLSQPDPAPTWSQGAKAQAIRAVRALATASRQPTFANDSAARLHRQLAADMKQLRAAAAPYGLYVTLYENGGANARGYAPRSDDALRAVLEASQMALRQLTRNLPAGQKNGARSPLAAFDLSIQVDVIGPYRRPTVRPLLKIFGSLFAGLSERILKLDPLGDLLSLSFDIEPGIDGLRIRLPEQPHDAVMLPADPITSGWLTPRVEGNLLAIKVIIERTLRRSFNIAYELGRTEFAVDTFRTTCFGALVHSDTPVDWIRGNTVIKGPLTRERLVERIIQTVDWLSRQVQISGVKTEAGRFQYETFPPYQKDSQGYNLVRHAGGAYGLLAFYRAAAREPRFAQAAQRALQAGLESLEPLRSSLSTPKGAADDLTCFFEEDGTASSGASALAALAMVELALLPPIAREELRARAAAWQADAVLSRLCACALAMVDAQGAVFLNYQEAKSNDRVRREPIYFPGEVLLALVRGYGRVKAPRFLEGAKRIADRQLRQNRWYLAFGVTRAGDHWMTQGLAELAHVTGDRKYAELSLLFGRGYLREQHPPVAYFYPDYLGSYYRFFDVPRTTRAASRGEALGGAVKAAVFLHKDAADLDAALVAGARHLIEQQFADSNSYFIPKGFDVQGAIRMGLIDNHCRIDNNQHGLIALLYALEAFDRQR